MPFQSNLYNDSTDTNVIFAHSRPYFRRATVLFELVGGNRWKRGVCPRRSVGEPSFLHCDRFGSCIYCNVQEKTKSICGEQIEYDIEPFFTRIFRLSGETVVSEKGIGMLIPVFSIVFLVLANRAIKKDEDLVKSVDRLR